MKAEPDSRIVKGKDVKFSVDDFEDIGISPWDGVRNHEAKNIMKDKMKLGDKVLFYHSNCKSPGVFALADIAREGYPDYTAWDPSHPYHDPKSSEQSPTWYMVSVRFKTRLQFPPTLALIKYLASCSSLPEEVGYIGKEGLDAIKTMQLVNRGRLSVQPVEPDAYDAIVSLGTKGGWEQLLAPAKPPSQRPASKTAKVAKALQLDKATKQADSSKKDKKILRRELGKNSTELSQVGERRSKRLKTA
ncbi:hypothetical protein IAT38_008288 [Cryptococcus sp. DSM 104549]